MSNYLKGALNLKETPQSEEAKPGQVENSAGGYVFPVDCWVQLDRFVTLGTEGGTYYVGEKEMSKKNIKNVQKCFKEDPIRTVNRTIEISDSGRAPKNDPALFVMAMALSLSGNTAQEVEAKKLAGENLSKVARIGTHLFHFLEYVNGMRGWGKSLKKAVRKWYTEKTTQQLELQLVKYQSRDGWSHRDALRLAHVFPKDKTVERLFGWTVKQEGWTPEQVDREEELRLVKGYELAKRLDPKDKTFARDMVNLIGEYKLMREALPTQALTKPEVWKALLPEMGLTALIRNLANMSRLEVIKPMSEELGFICKQLGNKDYLRRARVHPIQILSALLTYSQGHSERSDQRWQPIGQIVDALDKAFYLSFEFVEPTHKRWLLGLDVSGSMHGAMIAGIQGLDAAVAASALALVTANVEPNHHIVAFTSEGECRRPSRWSQYGSAITPLDISPRQRLDDVLKKVQSLKMGGTDCALPMIYAQEKKIPVDMFVVLTDNETWAGDIHPFQALKQYRRKMNIPAKMIVLGMTATDFSIADSSDAGMMDVVGFSTDTPVLMSNFARD